MATTTERPGANAPEVHKPPRSDGPWPVEFYRSAVGKKFVMAITGIGMIGFLIAHLVGNLKFYIGEHDINLYAEELRQLLYPLLPKESVLWVMRIGLAAMLVGHVHAAYSLTNMNRTSRGVGYQSSRDYAAANFASRSMRYTGAITFLYIVFHILDLTLGKTGADFEHGEVYDNMVASMSRWPVAAIYVIANIAVAVHLYHGAWSMFQSLGLNNPRYNAARKGFAIGISALIGLGNITFPILIVTGAVG